MNQLADQLRRLGWETVEECHEWGCKCVDGDHFSVFLCEVYRLDSDDFESWWVSVCEQFGADRVDIEGEITDMAHYQHLHDERLKADVIPNELYKIKKPFSSQNIHQMLLNLTKYIREETKGDNLGCYDGFQPPLIKYAGKRN